MPSLFKQKSFQLKRLSIILVVILTVILGFYYYRTHHIYKENLDKFYSITKEDPLFYDPNTDAYFLKKTALELKEMDDAILSANPKNKKENTYPLNWRLWPEDFLLNLSDIHLKTKDFFKKDNTESAVALLKAYEESVRNYKKSVELHIKALENIFAEEPTIKDRKILFLGSATTPQIVMNDFLLIHKNALRLEEEIAYRSRCLYWGACKNVNSKYSTDRNEKSKTIIFKPLSRSILGIDYNDRVYGPFWATTGCFGFTQNNLPYKHPFYVVEKKLKKSEGIFIQPMMTNDKYYISYEKSKTPIAEMYRARNISIKTHPEVNDYLCTDLRYIPDLVMQYLKARKGIDNKLSNENRIVTLPYIIQHTLSFSDYPNYLISYNKPLYLLTTRTSYSLYFGTFS